MDKIKVCAYGRVSTDSDDQANSFVNQREHFESKYNDSEKYEFVRFYGDEGKSGTSTKNRKEFLKMLYDAGLDFEETSQEMSVKLSDRESQFKRIIVKDITRFARNVDLLPAIRKLRQKGVYVDLEQYNLTTEDSTSGEMMIQFLMMFGELESKDKSKKVRFGQRAGMKKGVIAVAPYGYRKPDDGDKTRLELVDEEAEVVKYIYHQYQYGKGIRVILNQMNSKGILARSGKPFQKTTVTNILKNPIYKGSLIRNRYTTGTVFIDKKSTPQKKEESEWISYHNYQGIPVIIQPDIWERVQTVMKGKTNYQNQLGIKKDASQYANLIVCGKCGERYQSNVDRGKRFYNCRTKKLHGVKSCDNMNVYVSTIETYLDGLVRSGYHTYHIAKGVSILLAMKKRIEEIEQKKREHINHSEIKRIEGLIAMNRNEHMAYTQQYAKGNLTEDMFDDLIAPVIEEGERLKAELKMVKKTEAMFSEEIAEIIVEREKIAQIMDGSANLTREQIIDGIDLVEVNGDELKVVYKSEKLLMKPVSQYSLLV